MTKTHNNLLGYEGVVREITSLLSDYGLNFSTFEELFWLSMGVKPKPQTQILPSGMWLKPHDSYPNLFTKMPHEDIYFDFYFDFNEIPFLSLQTFIKKINTFFPGADAEELTDWTKGRMEIFRPGSSREYLDVIRIDSSKLFIYIMPKILNYLRSHPAFLDGRFTYSDVRQALAHEVCQFTSRSIDDWRGTNLIFDALCLFANVHFYKTQNFFAHKVDPANLLGLSVKGKADLKEIEGSDFSILSLDCDTSQLLNLKRLFNFYARDFQAVLCSDKEEKGNSDCLKVPNKVFMQAPFMKKFRAAMTRCFKEHELRYRVQLAFYNLERMKVISLELGVSPEEEKSESPRQDLVLEKMRYLKSRVFETKAFGHEEFAGILRSIDGILNPPKIEVKKKSLFSSFWRKSEPILPAEPICPQFQDLKRFFEKLMHLQAAPVSTTQVLMEHKQNSEPSTPTQKQNTKRI